MLRLRSKNRQRAFFLKSVSTMAWGRLGKGSCKAVKPIVGAFVLVLGCGIGQGDGASRCWRPANQSSNGKARSKETARAKATALATTRVTEPNTARVTAKEARRKARGKALTNLQHCSHDTGFNYWTSCGWAMPGKPILATNTWCRCCAIAKHRTSKPQERIASKALPVPP